MTANDGYDWGRIVGLMIAVARKRGLNLEDAQDTAQDVIAAWCRAGKPPVYSNLYWVRSVTRGVISRARKRTYRPAAVCESDLHSMTNLDRPPDSRGLAAVMPTAPDPADIYGNGSNGHLSAALATLTPRQRGVVVFGVNGYSDAEISDLMGMSRVNVRVMRGRARARLQAAGVGP